MGFSINVDWIAAVKVSGEWFNVEQGTFDVDALKLYTTEDQEPLELSGTVVQFGVAGDEEELSNGNMIGQTLVVPVAAIEALSCGR